MYFSSIFITLLFFLGSSAYQAKATEAPLPIIVSIAPQKWIIEQIADPNTVSITVLVRPGSDAHTYEPTPLQMKKVADAKVYFTIGLPFETIWAPRIASAAKGISLCSMIEGLQLQKLSSQEEASHDRASYQKIEEIEANTEEHHSHHHHHHHHDGVDPHTWLSPHMVIKMIPNVVKELSRQMPEKEKMFVQNAETFQKEIERIDASMRKQLSRIDQEKRVFLTFHPAWFYFAKEYGLKELTIEVEGKEPSPKALKNIIDLAKKFAITTIFSEPQFPRSAVDTIAKSIHAKVFIIDPLGENVMETWEYMIDLLMDSLENED